MNIEVAFCYSESNFYLKSVSVPAGSLVKDVLSYCNLAQQFPDVDFSSLKVGIFSELVSGERVLEEGDRVEYYRPLTISPMEKRRLLAANRDRKRKS